VRGWQGTVEDWYVRIVMVVVIVPLKLLLLCVACVFDFSCFATFRAPSVFCTTNIAAVARVLAASSHILSNCFTASCLCIRDFPTCTGPSSRPLTCAVIYLLILYLFILCFLPATSSQSPGIPCRQWAINYKLAHSPSPNRKLSFQFQKKNENWLPVITTFWPCVHSSVVPCASPS